MGSTSGGRREVRRNAATTRVAREIVAATVASAIMALMVAGGGIAVERMTTAQTSAAEAAFSEPAPLSWGEAT